MGRGFLVALVIAHFAVVIGNLLSFFVLPFYADWYVAFPCCSFIVLITFSREPCPLTRLENKLRKGLGMDEVKGFMRHYIVLPLRKRCSRS